MMKEQRRIACRKKCVQPIGRERLFNVKIHLFSSNKLLHYTYRVVVFIGFGFLGV